MNRRPSLSFTEDELLQLVEDFIPAYNSEGINAPYLRDMIKGKTDKDYLSPNSLWEEFEEFLETKI